MAFLSYCKKELLIAVIYYVALLWSGSALAAEFRISAGSGSNPPYAYRVYRGLPSKTYISYYGSGTFSCGGTFEYGVEVWNITVFPRVYVMDLCAMGANKTYYTCAGYPCASVSLVNMIDVKYLECAFLCAGNESAAYDYPLDYGWFLRWYPLTNYDTADYDCDGLPNIDDCKVCSQETCFTPNSGITGFGNRERGMYQFKAGRKGRGMGGYERKGVL